MCRIEKDPIAEAAHTRLITPLTPRKHLPMNSATFPREAGVSTFQSYRYDPDFSIDRSRRVVGSPFDRREVGRNSPLYAEDRLSKSSLLQSSQCYDRQVISQMNKPKVQHTLEKKMPEQKHGTSANACNSPTEILEVKRLSIHDVPQKRINETKAPEPDRKKRATSPPSKLQYHFSNISTSGQAQQISKDDDVVNMAPRVGDRTEQLSSIRHLEYLRIGSRSPHSSESTGYSSAVYDTSGTFKLLKPKLDLSTSIARETLSVGEVSDERYSDEDDNDQIPRQGWSQPSSASSSNFRPLLASHSSGGRWKCHCCPKKPAVFESEDDLRIHEIERNYTCQYCSNRFKNRKEVKRHQNALHIRKSSWSCGAITSVKTAFFPTTEAPSTLPSGQHAYAGVMGQSNVQGASAYGNDTADTDTCGYCGETFANPPNWKERVDHLIEAHRFGECDQSKKFFRADHFRQHLKLSHGSASGKWADMLKDRCMKDEAKSPTP